MKTKALVLVMFGLLAGPVVAQESSIAGDWSGIGVAVTVGAGNNGAEELANLMISTPLANGDFVGTLDVTCVGYKPSQCGSGGALDISGSLSPGGTLDFGLAGNPDLFAGTYSGGDTFTGVATSLDGDVYDFTVNRASVPEPATLSLLGLALAGVGFLRKRKGPVSAT